MHWEGRGGGGATHLGGAQQAHEEVRALQHRAVVLQRVAGEAQVGRQAQGDLVGHVRPPELVEQATDHGGRAGAGLQRVQFLVDSAGWGDAMSDDSCDRKSCDGDGDGDGGGALGVMAWWQ